MIFRAPTRKKKLWVILERNPVANGILRPFDDAGLVALGWDFPLSPEKCNVRRNFSFFPMGFNAFYGTYQVHKETLTTEKVTLPMNGLVCTSSFGHQDHEEAGGKRYLGHSKAYNNARTRGPSCT